MSEDKPEEALVPKLTGQEVMEFQQQMTVFAKICHSFNPDVIARYLLQTAPLVDGPHDPEAARTMTIEQLITARKNIIWLRTMAVKVQEVQRVCADVVAEEQERRLRQFN